MVQDKVWGKKQKQDNPLADIDLCDVYSVHLKQNMHTRRLLSRVTASSFFIYSIFYFLFEAFCVLSSD